MKPTPTDAGSRTNRGRQPHVLLICTDHWSGAMLGSAGHPWVQTPTLDALARGGVRFSRAYSECPVCIPARRTLMTGTTCRIHGDRNFHQTLPMPDLPTLAGVFRDHGYQAYAAGKLHVYPQRARIGFDDVALAEEGRAQFGVVDDYEEFLARQGFPGMVHAHGLSVNGYETRTWPLPEHCHVTNWITAEMMRFIKRRDPTRPGFWYLSYTHPHPPLVPLAEYLQRYADTPETAVEPAAWAADEDRLPEPLLVARHRYGVQGNMKLAAQRAHYALCTHIDHQLRLVLGTLREEGLLDDTIILFTADHGDMLGRHGFWAKGLCYEDSARIPLILLGTAGDQRIGLGRVDDRLAGLQDVMPTLLDLAGLPCPPAVTGRSLVSAPRRRELYGECFEGLKATRMICTDRWKLIYYPAGNRFQLFDLANDPHESRDLAADPRHAERLRRLQDRLRRELYGADRAWIRGRRWIGLPPRSREAVLQDLHGQARTLVAQRGSHWPPPAPH